MQTWARREKFWARVSGLVVRVPVPADEVLFRRGGIHKVRMSSCSRKATARHGSGKRNESQGKEGSVFLFFLCLFVRAWATATAQCQGRVPMHIPPGNKTSPRSLEIYSHFTLWLEAQFYNELLESAPDFLLLLFPFNLRRKYWRKTSPDTHGPRLMAQGGTVIHPLLTAGRHAASRIPN